MAENTIPALAELTGDIVRQVTEYGSLNAVPARAVQNVRNDMYLISEALRRMGKSHEGGFDAAGQATLDKFVSVLDGATKYIPTWVKVAVAIALGLGTIVVAPHGDYRRRAYRQTASHLRARRLGRVGRDGDDRCPPTPTVFQSRRHRC